MSNPVIRFLVWTNNVAASLFGWIPGVRSYIRWGNGMILRHQAVYTVLGVLYLAGYAVWITRMVKVAKRDALI